MAYKSLLNIIYIIYKFIDKKLLPFILKFFMIYSNIYSCNWKYVILILIISVTDISSYHDWKCMKKF